MTEKEKLHMLDEVFSRGIGQCVDPDNSLREKITKKIKGEYPQDIIIKLGVDPTRPDIHLGHAVVLRKLRRLQDLGCKVIFLVGDYTTQIGDPTGKSKVRPDIEQAEVDANAKTYIEQVGKILRTEEAVFSWIRNSEWFYGVTDLIAPPHIQKINIETQTTEGNKATLAVSPNSYLGKAIFYESTRMQKTHLNKNEIFAVTLKGLLWTLKHVTHSALIQRDMFQDRLNNHEELYMHEMLYPILQGIDSFMIASIYGSCDLEVGGTDQHFNMLMGRTVMKANKMSEQSVISFEILVGLDGKEKMSKSLDNYVAITDEPADMYGKIMSIPDSAISQYYELATYTPLDEIAEMKKAIEADSVNPKDIKMKLARQIVAEYHGEKEATRAEEDFVTKFQKKEIPDVVPEINAVQDAVLSEVLLAEAIIESKSEFRRLIEEGAITDLETNEKLNNFLMKIEKPLLLKIGKKRFLKINI